MPRPPASQSAPDGAQVGIASRYMVLGENFLDLRSPGNQQPIETCTAHFVTLSYRQRDGKLEWQPAVLGHGSYGQRHSVLVGEEPRQRSPHDGEVYVAASNGFYDPGRRIRFGIVAEDGVSHQVFRHSSTSEGVHGRRV